MTIITLQPLTLWQQILERLCPSRAEQRSELLRNAIKHLLEHPEEPCIVNGHYIPNGYGGYTQSVLDQWSAGSVDLADNG